MSDAHAPLAQERVRLAAGASGDDAQARASRAWRVPAVLCAALAVVSLASLCTGAVGTSPREVVAVAAWKAGLTSQAPVDSRHEAVLVHIRLPRIVLGMLVGGALAISGAAMQGLFRNPLADPSLIGVSAGAAAAVVAATVLGRLLWGPITQLLGGFLVPVVAFAGALSTAAGVYAFSLVSGRTVVATMLLAGIGVNALAGALTGLLIYTANDEQLRTVTFWSLGSLGGASWKTVALAAPFLSFAIVSIPRLAVALNAMVLGEAEAAHLGIAVERIKRVLLVAVALGVGAAVAVAGMIGFVGLVVPHVLRLVLGADHRRLLPSSALLGAVLLLAADLAARTVVVPAELPIGILTALFGAPFLLWLLGRARVAARC